MHDNPITDDEVLYRRVPIKIKGLLKTLPDGTLKVSSQAFQDPNHRPSVDRAKLCEYNPRRTLGPYPGGVVSIITGDVRSIIDLVQYGRDQHPLGLIKVDVEPKPIFDDPTEPDNPAHAEIYTDPSCSRNAFQRLCERLALLANSRPWEIEPPGLRNET